MKMNPRKITRRFLEQSDIILERDQLESIPEDGLTVTEFAELDLPERDILWILLTTTTARQKRQLIHLWADRYIERAEYYTGKHPLVVITALIVLKRLALSYRPRHDTLVEDQEYTQTQLIKENEGGDSHKPENQVKQVLIEALQENEHGAVQYTAAECAKLTHTIRGTCYEDTYGVMIADVIGMLNEGDIK